MSRASLVFCVLLCFLLPLLSLALTCVLAWLTALLTSRMRNKTVFTMVLSLAFWAPTSISIIRSMTIFNC